MEKRPHDTLGRNDNNSLKTVLSQSDSYYSKTATNYSNRESKGPEKSRLVFDPCRENNITKQLSFWFCLKMVMMICCFMKLEEKKNRVVNFLLSTGEISATSPNNIMRSNFQQCQMPQTLGLVERDE